MNQYMRLNIIMLILFCYVSSNASRKQIRKSNEYSIEKTWIPKERWLREFKFRFGKSFCKGNSTYKKCLNRSKKNCMFDLENALKGCTKQLSTPPLIPSGPISASFGSRMGICIGKYMIKLHQGKRRKRKC